MKPTSINSGTATSSTGGGGGCSFLDITAREMNERIFMAFPIGWMVGIVVGAVYSGFHWDNLRPELGRTLIFAIGSAQITTLLITMWVFHRMFPKAPDYIHDDEE